MMSKGFEDLEVWRKAVQLSVEIYRTFKDLKDFGFKEQITKASLSCPSNIAEGFERESNKEFIHFYIYQRVHAGN